VTQVLLDLRRRIQPAQQRRLDGWREYEARKQRWAAGHPDATHEEYERAMRKIAEECGV
jgi:hypothetical protein